MLYHSINLVLSLSYINVFFFSFFFIVLFKQPYTCHFCSLLLLNSLHSPILRDFCVNLLAKLIKRVVLAIFNSSLSIFSLTYITEIVLVTLTYGLHIDKSYFLLLVFILSELSTAFDAADLLFHLETLSLLRFYHTSLF